MFREGKSCAIYLRVSTEMQVDGFILDGQRNTLKRYAEREGMIVKQIYEDAGKSGKSIEGRPAFQKMLTDIKGGLLIDYILVYKLSRFGRNAADILNSLELIQSYDINLIATEEGIDSSQTSGKLLISVLSAVSEIERENIIEQTMNGRREKARQGGWNGGFAPYGYELVNGKLVINEYEAAQVKTIFDLYANTSMGYNSVVKEMNLRGSKVKRQNGKNDFWGVTTIRRILDNPVYTGKIAFGRRTKEKIKGTRDGYRTVHADNYILEEGQHEAIISEEIWNIVREKRERTGVKHAPILGYERSHLLSGILRCPGCGSVMHTSKRSASRNKENVGAYWYYTCSNSKYNSHNRCTFGRSIREDVIDPYVGILVAELVKSEEFISIVKEKLQIKVDSAEVETEMNQYKSSLKDAILNKNRLEEEIDNMPSDIKNRAAKIDKLNQRLYSLYDKIEQLEEKIDDCKAKMVSLKNEELTVENVKTLLENFNSIYDVITEDERKQLIRYLFNRIDLYPDFSKDRLIKSVELNFRIHNNQKVIQHILNEESNKSTLINNLSRIEPEVTIPVEVNLEENNLLQNIYDKATITYKEQHPVILKQRGPYKKDKATNKEMREYIKEKYNIAVYNCEITAVKKYYGIFKERANQQDNYRMPTEIKIEVIKETLIHFTYLDADCKPVDEAEEFTPNRSKHYIKKHATYKEIKEYIFETYGVKVHAAYIAEIKRKHGVEMINVRSTEESLKRAKHPTPAMTKIIEETLVHFGIINVEA